MSSSSSRYKEMNNNFEGLSEQLTTVRSNQDESPADGVAEIGLPGEVADAEVVPGGPRRHDVLLVKVPRLAEQQEHVAVQRKPLANINHKKS